jgi:DNA-binding NarL/FixJ family response regulator
VCVVAVMATAIKSAGEASATAVGVCLQEGFPEVELRELLDEAGYETAFEQPDPGKAIELCRSSRPDVLLVGVSRPGPETLELAAEAAKADPGIKVILICERSDNGTVRKALEAGVGGVVSLVDLGSALPPVIEVVRVGQVSVPGSRSAELQKRILTAREKQVLGLVVMGLTNAEIAAKLFLAESTVKSHLSSAFAKLGVASRSEAASVILDPRSSAGLGILTIPSS